MFSVLRPPISCTLDPCPCQRILYPAILPSLGPLRMLTHAALSTSMPCLLVSYLGLTSSPLISLISLHVLSLFSILLSVYVSTIHSSTVSRHPWPLVTLHSGLMFPFASPRCTVSPVLILPSTLRFLLFVLLYPPTYPLSVLSLERNTS